MNQLIIHPIIVRYWMVPEVLDAVRNQEHNWAQGPEMLYAVSNAELETLSPDERTALEKAAPFHAVHISASIRFDHKPLSVREFLPYLQV